MHVIKTIAIAAEIVKGGCRLHYFSNAGYLLVIIFKYLFFYAAGYKGAIIINPINIHTF